MNPAGPGARTIALLWWVMFGVATFVILLIGGLVLTSILRRRAPDPRADPPWARGLIYGGGVVFPLIVLTALWVLVLHDIGALSDPGNQRLTIDVIGHRWWWEVRYPQQGIATANDIHIPVSQPVEIRLTTADVLHSFWVPQLTGKTDMIAGRVNHMTVQASRAGVYRGQCAEFCGLQHANMIFYVVADPPDVFRAWLARETQGPSPPTDPTLARGEQVFVNAACVACHTIKNTPANGSLGPDLSNMGGRLSIGAGALPNTLGNLAGWVIDSQDIKPGNLMPRMELPAQDLQALVAYLESLR
jgi:cytochrome c oxidase subunit 2